MGRRGTAAERRRNGPGRRARRPQRVRQGPGVGRPLRRLGPRSDGGKRKAMERGSERPGVPPPPIGAQSGWRGPAAALISPPLLPGLAGERREAEG